MQLILAVSVDSPRHVVMTVVGVAVARGWNCLIIGDFKGSADTASTIEEHLFETLFATNTQGSMLLACDALCARVLTRIKSERPHSTCAGLVSYPKSASIAELVDTTYDTALENRWTVGAALQPTQKRYLILTSERGLQPASTLSAFAGGLLEALASRLSQDHYRTRLQVVCEFPSNIQPEVEALLEVTRRWAQWALFPRYQSSDKPFAEAEFGFIACRTVAGTLITARGSNKEAPTIEDLALIESISPEGDLVTLSLRRKASLNAPIAHRIFEARPEIRWILHAHIFLAEGVTAPATTAPGTETDWAAIKEAVLAGVQVINQPLHGCLVLLSDPKELLPLLVRNGLYQRQSELYDLAYARFQGTESRKTHFEDSIESLKLPASTAVLDLCCGTGASTLALEASGFTDVGFADGSPAMLAVAETRLGRKGKLISLGHPGRIAIRWNLGLITMRQAFNYVQPLNLERFFCMVFDALAPGGFFVFNTFGVLAPGSMPARDFSHESPLRLVRTREHNEVTSAEVLHCQRTEILDFQSQRWHAVLDVNRFFQHPEQIVTNGLWRAGFHVEVRRRGSSLLFLAQRPLH